MVLSLEVPSPQAPPVNIEKEYWEGKTLRDTGPFKV